MDATKGLIDPLGANMQVADYNSLIKWGDTLVPEYDIMVDDPNNMKKSPFLYDAEINKKVSLWFGDISCLNTEAIVHSTNESMTDKNQISENIHHRAGVELRREIKQNIKTCKTGDAKITKGYKLPARYVIHTVGPRYNIKYKTAAESALFNAYRSVLQIVREKNISSLGLCCVHSLRRGYPPYEGAHIGIRAVRRFLEKFPDMEKVVFVVGHDDEDTYKSLMPLYFPRSKSEEDYVAYHVPYDVGNEEGEPVIKDRQIRIMGKPNLKKADSGNAEHPLFEESVNINEVFETSVAVGAHAFSKMEGDIDKKRKATLRSQQNINSNLQQAEERKRYDRWLRRARQEDLSDIARLRCLYQSGFDKYGRPVVVFVGRNFAADVVDPEKAVLYLISVMDSIVSRNFVVVYLHTMTEKGHQPESSFLRDIYNLMDSRYKNNLAALYIVHPTFWSKVVTWFFTTFSMSNMKSRVHNLPGLEYLYTRILPDQLDLPDFVIDYDMKVNGTRYYNPEEDQAIGAL